jgi:hypothetical protein
MADLVELSVALELADSKELSVDWEVAVPVLVDSKEGMVVPVELSVDWEVAVPMELSVD